MTYSNREMPVFISYCLKSNAFISPLRIAVHRGKSSHGLKPDSRFNR